MIYPVKVPGFENQSIEVDQGAFGRPKLLFNGRPAPKGNKRGEMLLRRDNGSEAVATWKMQFAWFDIPKLVVDEKEIQVVESLKWYEYVWSGLPILLVIAGGLIGAVFGTIGFIINARIFRSSMSKFLKYILTAGVTILTVVIYFVLAMIFATIFNIACPS